MSADPALSPPGSSTGLDPLRLVICPACGYSLEGLPSEGVCPECGGGYDQSAIILHGWALGSHANLSNLSPPRAVVTVVASAFFILLLLARSRQSASPVLLVVVAGWLGVMAVMLWRRFTATAPGLVRVRLSASGCAQNDQPGSSPDPIPLAWRAVGGVLLEQTHPGRYWLRIKERRAWWQRGYAPVDAEVKLEPEQAVRLREWIDTQLRQWS